MEAHNELSPDQQQQRLIFSILEYLNDLKNSNTEHAESLEVAMQCISDSFGLDVNNNEHKMAHSINPLTLPAVFGLGIARKEQIEAVLSQKYKTENPQTTSPTAVRTPQTPHAPPPTDAAELKFIAYRDILKSRGYFDDVVEGSPEYHTRLEKARAKFMEKYHSADQPPVLSKEEKEKMAEDYKTQGNKKLADHQYQDAVDLYTKAIELIDSNAIYFANRAAAYSQLNQHQLAIEDCKLAVQKNPSYGKAYSRMGLAYYSLGQYEEAVQYYQKALELDSNNASIKESLETAKRKLTPSSPPQAAPTMPAGLESMMNNPAMQNFAQQFQRDGGGQPDFANLLNNPNLMNMAQNVMSQPGFSDMLNNPAMMNMAQSFMQNPDALGNIMKSVFGKGDEQQDGNN